MALHTAHRDSRFLLTVRATSFLGGICLAPIRRLLRHRRVQDIQQMAHGLGELTLGELAKLKSILAPLPRIEVTDFVAAVQAVTSKPGDPQLLRLVYALIDRDGSGDVSWDELIEHIESLRHEEVFDSGSRPLYDEQTIAAPRPMSKTCFHTGVIRHTAMSPSSNRLVTAADDGCVKLWDATTLSYEGTLLHGITVIRSLDLDRETDTLSVLSTDQVISVFNVGASRLLHTFQAGSKSMAHYGIPNEVYRREMRIAKASDPIPYIGLKTASSVLARMWAAQHNMFLQRVWAHGRATETFGSVKLPDTTGVATAVSGCRSAEKDAADFITFVGMSDGGVQGYQCDASVPMSVDALAQKKIDAKRHAEQAPLLHFRNHTDEVTWMRTDRENTEAIITASADSDIHFTHIERGVILRTLKGSTRDTLRSHARGVIGFEMSRSPKMIGSWGKERFAVIWDPVVGKPLQALHGHVSQIVGLKFTPFDDHLIVTYSQDKAIRIWDVRTFRCLQQIREGSWETHGQAGALHYDASTKNIVTCTQRLYMKRQNARVFEDDYQGHTRSVLSVSYCHYNSLLCSCDEISVRMWDCDAEELQVAWSFERIEGLCLDALGNTMLVDESSPDVRVLSTTNAQTVISLVGGRRRRRSGSADIRTVYDAIRGLWVVVTADEIYLYPSAFDPRVVTYPSPIAVHEAPRESAAITSCVLFGVRIILGLRDGNLAIASLRDLKHEGEMDAVTFESVEEEQKGSFALRSVPNGPLHRDVEPIVRHVSTIILRRKAYIAKVRGIVAEEVEDPEEYAGDDDALGARVADESADFQAAQDLVKARRRLDALCRIGGDGRNGTDFIVAGNGGGQLILAHAPLAATLLRWRVSLRVACSITSLDALGPSAVVYGDEMGYCGVFDLQAVIDCVEALKVRVPTLHVHNLVGHDWASKIHRSSFFRASNAAVTVVRWVAKRDVLAIGSMDGCMAFFSRAGQRLRVLGVKPNHTIPFPVATHAPEYRSTVAMFRKNAVLSVLSDSALDIRAIVGRCRAEHPELFEFDEACIATVHDMCPVAPERQFEALLAYNPGSGTYCRLQPKEQTRNRAAYQVTRPLHAKDTTDNTVTEWTRIHRAADVPRQPALLESRAEAQSQLLSGLVAIGMRSRQLRQGRYPPSLIDAAVSGLQQDSHGTRRFVVRTVEKIDSEAMAFALRAETSERKRLVDSMMREMSAMFTDMLRRGHRFILGQYLTDTGLHAVPAVNHPAVAPLPIKALDELPSAVTSSDDSASVRASSPDGCRWSVPFRDALLAQAWNNQMDRTRRLRIASVIDEFSEHCDRAVRRIVHFWWSDWSSLRTSNAEQDPQLVRIDSTMWYCDGALIVHCTAVDTLARHTRAPTTPVASLLSGRKLALNQLKASQALLSTRLDAPVTLLPPLVCCVAYAGLTFSCSAVSDVESHKWQRAGTVLCAAAARGPDVDGDDDGYGPEEALNATVTPGWRLPKQPQSSVEACMRNLAVQATLRVCGLTASGDDVSLPVGMKTAVLEQHRCVVVRGIDAMFPAHASTFQEAHDMQILRQRTEGSRVDGSSSLISSRCFDRAVHPSLRRDADRDANKSSRKTATLSVASIVDKLMAPSFPGPTMANGRIIEYLHSEGMNVRFIGSIAVALRRRVNTMRQHLSGGGRRRNAGPGYHGGGSVLKGMDYPAAGEEPPPEDSPSRDLIGAARGTTTRRQLLASWERSGPAVTLQLIHEEMVARVWRDFIWAASLRIITGYGSGDSIPPHGTAHHPRTAVGMAKAGRGAVRDAGEADGLLPLFEFDCRAPARHGVSEAEAAAQEVLHPLLLCRTDGGVDALRAFWERSVKPALLRCFPDFATDEKVHVSPDEVNLTRLLNRILDLSGLELIVQNPAGDQQCIVRFVSRIKQLDAFHGRVSLRPSETKLYWEEARAALSTLPDAEAAMWSACVVSRIPHNTLTRTDWSTRLAPIFKETFARRTEAATSHPWSAILDPAGTRRRFWEDFREVEDLLLTATLLVFGGGEHRDVSTRIYQGVADYNVRFLRTCTDPREATAVISSLLVSQQCLSESAMLQYHVGISLAAATAVHNIVLKGEALGLDFGLVPRSSEAVITRYLPWANARIAAVEGISDSSTNLASARVHLLRNYHQYAAFVGETHLITLEAVEQLGRLLLRSEQEDDARAAFAQLSDVAKTVYGPLSPPARRAYLAMGLTEMQCERYSAALDCFKELRLCRSAPWETPLTAECEVASHLARALMASGLSDDALAVVSGAVKLFAAEEIVPDAGLECLRIKASLLLMPRPLSGHSAAGSADDVLRGVDGEPQYEEAYATLNDLLAAVERRFGACSPEAADAVAAMGDVFAAEGRNLEALQMYLLGEHLALRLYGANHRIVALHQVRRARAHAALGDVIEATRDFRAALSLFRLQRFAVQTANSDPQQGQRLAEAELDAEDPGETIAPSTSSKVRLSEPQRRGPTADDVEDAFERSHFARMIADLGVLLLTDAMQHDIGSSPELQEPGPATASPGLDSRSSSRVASTRLQTFGGTVEREFLMARDCLRAAMELALTELSDLRHPFPALLRAYLEGCEQKLAEFADASHSQTRRQEQQRIISEWTARGPAEIAYGRHHNPLWFRQRLKLFKLRSASESTEGRLASASD